LFFFIAVSLGLGHQDLLGPAWAAKYEVAPIRKAEEVLPKKLARGEHHKVLDGVETHTSMHLFQVQTDLGQFKALGELKLRLWLREIAALAELKKITDARVLGETLKRSATGSLDAASKFIRHPGETVKGLSAGLRRRFGSIKRDVNEAIEDAKVLDKDLRAGETASGKRIGKKYGKKYVDIDKAERRWAAKLGVDPYTTNDILRREITRIATIDALADLGTKPFMPSFAIVSEVADVYKMASFKDSRELFDMNRKRLAAFGASSKLIDAFFRVKDLTPTYQTMIVSALTEMKGVGDRWVVVEQALTVKSEVDAIWFMETVVMAGWFHSKQAPLTRMVAGTGVPVALTKDKRLIVFTGADYTYWTKEVGQISRDFTDRYSRLSTRREVWVAGRASKKFISGVKRQGWIVRPDNRAKYLPRIPWAIQ
jgi:hypothetical protein